MPDADFIYPPQAETCDLRLVTLSYGFAGSVTTRATDKEENE